MTKCTKMATKMRQYVPLKYGKMNEMIILHPCLPISIVCVIMILSLLCKSV